MTSDERLQREFGGDYDIVAANIVSDVILTLSTRVRPLLRPGGAFLCSGIIDTRAAEVRARLEEAHWQIEREDSDQGWYAYLCR